MSDKLILAQQFAETYPQAAARALEALATEPTSKLLEALPDKESASLLGSMLPYYAARCVTQLTPEAASKYLGGLEPRLVANILRHSTDETRRAVLAKLPRRLAPRVTIILNYSTSMIGAWLQPSVLTLPIECTVEEAQSRIRNEGAIEYHRVYVVDAEQSLRGVVNLSSLIVEAGNVLLSHCLRPVTRFLRATTGLDMALEDTAWLESDYLPVVDRREKFIGVLRYAELRAASARPRTISADQDISGSFMDLAETCYLGLAEVMNSSLAVDQSVRREEGH